MGGRWLIAVLLMLPACKEDAFFCTNDDQCMEGGLAGICQSNDLCSFPSDDCPSGQVYGKYSGTLAGRCVDDDAVAGTTSDTGIEQMTTGPGGSTSSATSSGTQPGVTATSEVTDTGETSSPTTDPTTGPTTDPTTNSDTGSGTGTGGEPNGSPCAVNDDCASGACYDSVLGSVCGECVSDADCEFGCTPSYPLDPSERWSMCNEGGLGDSCEDSSACASDDLQCVSFANIAGLLSISTCSECANTADCPGSMVCNEFFNASDLLGGFACANPNSLFDGAFCTVGPAGESACMGHCSPGNYMGLFNFGVCSECGSDADCPNGLSCAPPELDLEAGTSTTAMCL